MLNPRFCPGRCLFVLLLLAATAFPAAVSAQVANSLGGLIIADRNRTRVLRQAQEMIADEKYVDALALLQTLLEQDQDQLLRPDSNENDGAFRSFKSEIQRTIGNLPPDGQAVYLRNNSPLAKALLKEAITENDEKKLADVARLYFHTPAGYEATYRIAIRHFDHGEPMAAALILQRLQRTPEAARLLDPMLSLRIALAWVQAGMPDEAAASLKSLKAQIRDREIAISGERRPIFTANGDTAKWLSQLIQDGGRHLADASDWLFPRGTPSRNAILSVPQPADSRPWQVSTVFFHPDGSDPEEELVLQTDEQLKALVPRQEEQRSRQTRHLLSSHRPIVVKGLVISRMLINSQAFDLESGELLQVMFSWDAALESLTGLDYNEEPRIANADHLIGQWINQRLWEDQTNGTLSSDGERLFVVEETGFWTPIPAQGNRKAVPVTSANVLTAFDLEYGKMVWDVGGVPVPAGDPPRNLEGRYFLGPPLPLAGQLYCLVDYQNEVQLNVLNAATGELEWSQPLAAASHLTIDRDLARRTSGVSVAYADGVLVCPTDAGATVALDLTTRSLLWGFPTEIAPSFQPGAGARRRNGRAPQQGVLPQGWVDSTPTIYSGKVVLTPLKSSRIYLLDLRTGKRIWDQPRGQGLYVAGVVNDTVIVVGQRNVQSWNVDNDQTRWDPIGLSSPPTGRGVIVENNLLLPAGKELLVVDLKTGRETRKISVPAEAGDLGNLVVAQGRLISQSADNIRVMPFPKLDP